MTNIYFPLGIFALSIGMLAAHSRTWRRVKATSLDEAELRYRHGQFRRRMQASFLLALVAPAMLVGGQLDTSRAPWLFLGLWGTVIAATCFVVWLALLDALASGRHFRRVIRERAAVRERLHDELERLAAAARSGAAATTQEP